jgi:dipeptidase E
LRPSKANFLNSQSFKACMPKYYLLGGENTYRRDAKEVNQIAFQEAGQTPSILVFSWARASFDRAYRKRKKIFDYFISLGAGTVEIADYSSSTSEIEQKISQTDLVYLTGGIPSVLVERLRQSCVDSLLKDYEGVVVGRSAGALALCRKCVVTYRSSLEAKVIDGLGLVDLTAKAHYKPDRDEQLERLSLYQDVFALPKGSALVVSNGELTFINTIYLFHLGKKQTIN